MYSLKGLLDYTHVRDRCTHVSVNVSVSVSVVLVKSVRRPIKFQVLVFTFPLLNDTRSVEILTWPYSKLDLPWNKNKKSLSKVGLRTRQNTWKGIILKIFGFSFLNINVEQGYRVKWQRTCIYYKWFTNKRAHSFSFIYVFKSLRNSKWRISRHYGRLMCKNRNVR